MKKSFDCKFNSKLKNNFIKFYSIENLQMHL